MSEAGQEQAGYGTLQADLFAALSFPFGAGEVKIREQAGRKLRYITARTVMNRLDDVVGPENWWDDFTPNANSVLCRLTIRFPNGECLTKADAGGYAGMADQGDDGKSGYSDAFKRAAVKFGIGRYLYNDGAPGFVVDRANASEKVELLGRTGQANAGGQGGGGSYRSAPQTAPARDHRDDDRSRVNRELAGGQSQGDGHGHGQSHGGQDKPPHNGRALFAWVKKREEETKLGILKYVNQWAKLQDIQGRMIDWEPEQVQLAYAEANRKVQAELARLQGGNAEHGRGDEDAY